MGDESEEVRALKEGRVKTKPINDAQFEKEVLKRDGLVIVEFWASWCRPCKVMYHAIDELSSEYEGEVTFVRLNVDEYPEIPRQFNVRSVPTLLFFSSGRIVEKVVGISSTLYLEAIIERLLPVPV